MNKNEYSGEEMVKIICQALEQFESSRKKVVIMNREAVANRLHVSKVTLWRWHKSGYLHAIKYGRAVWYREEDIEAFERGERITNFGGSNDE